MPPIPKPAKSPGGSATGNPGGSTELTQLSELASLLRRSAAVRARLEATTRAVDECTLSADLGLSRLDQVIVSRSELLASVAATDISQIPDGSQLRAEFVSALGFSLAADGEFADWLRSVAGGACPVPTLSVSSFQAAQSDSGLANAAKVEFLRQWNLLAGRFGEPEFRASQI
jgi:hypothetical protein